MKTNSIDRNSKLKLLEEEVGSCVKCQLHSTRTKIVFSRGSQDALVGICAEAPGENEDLAGLPLVGKSGQLLNQVIEELVYDIEKDIYIFNTIKCRPPNNRRPEPEEISACGSYLQQQWDLISSIVIITLGGTATNVITNRIEGITKLRGQVIECKGKLIFPSFHPSFILRSGGSNSKQYTQFKDDIKAAFDRAREIQQTKGE